MNGSVTEKGAGRRNLRRRLTALLVHGMGAGPEWWNPIVPSLERVGITPRPLAMPSLEHSGPEAWRDEVLAHVGKGSVLLIGHSLGAAVCMEVAGIKPTVGLVLLACPPFFRDFSPPPPPKTALSVTATARIARFLQQACTSVSSLPDDAVHFVGAVDPWVPLEQARRLPLPLVVIPRAGHDLNRSAAFASKLLRHILASRLALEHLDPEVRRDYV